jgi:Periplasmic binding protein/Pyridoxamine 5'-phosphate oxidase
LTGALAAIGEDVKATLAASFAEINEKGGIYGRRFELVVEDSGGDPAQTLVVTRRLIEQHGVFALVGSFESGDSEALHELIKRSEIPVVGPPVTWDSADGTWDWQPEEEELLKVKNMAMGEMQALLLRVGFGHLGCTQDDHPYVVPMHYAYDGQDLYLLVRLDWAEPPEES